MILTEQAPYWTKTYSSTTLSTKTPTRTDPGSKPGLCDDRPTPWVHPASCTMGADSFSLGQSGRGVALTTHSHLAQELKKEYSYTSTPRPVLQVKFTYERMKQITVGKNHPNMSAVRM